MVNIHPTAVVSPHAQIGEGTTIGAFTFVEDDVVIGEHCNIMNQVSILNGARIGDQVRVHQGAIIAGLPQDLKFAGEKTTCEIGDRTVVREFATLNRGTSDKWKTVVGADCLIMAYVHLAHDVSLGNHVILANAVQIAGHVDIGYHVTVGGMTPVHQFVKIGDHAFIGGGLRVHKDVPPFVLAMGEPMVYGGLNKVGLERRGFTKETLNSLRDAYRVIYDQGLVRTQAIKKLETEFEPSEEMNTLISFVKASDRGMIGSRR